MLGGVGVAGAAEAPQAEARAGTPRADSFPRAAVGAATSGEGAGGVRVCSSTSGEGTVGVDLGSPTSGEGAASVDWPGSAAVMEMLGVEATGATSVFSSGFASLKFTFPGAHGADSGHCRAQRC